MQYAVEDWNYHHYYEMNYSVIQVYLLLELVHDVNRILMDFVRLSFDDEKNYLIEIKHERLPLLLSNDEVKHLYFEYVLQVIKKVCCDCLRVCIGGFFFISSSVICLDFSGSLDK